MYTIGVYINMIRTRLAGVEIGADFTFFALVAMFSALDTTGLAMMSLAVCLIHEAGHLLFMRKKPESIVFRGGGIRIKASDDSVLVLAAGSLTNLAMFLIFYSAYPMFAVMNLVIGVFNLLPIGCLDGSKLLMLFVPEKVMRVINVIAIIAVIALVILYEVNFTILAVILYVTAVDFFVRM